MNILKYDISETQYLQLDLPDKIDCDECEVCLRMIVRYVDTVNNLDIPFGDYAIHDFHEFLTDSETLGTLLTGQRVLHEDTLDLGYEHNQFNADKEYNQQEDFRYHWMSNFDVATCAYYNSWLYNDAKGNIIFEITPKFPWFSWFKQSKGCPGKIPYKQWIKSYKRIVKVIIPKENMQQWAIQADKLGEKYGVKF